MEHSRGFIVIGIGIYITRLSLVKAIVCLAILIGFQISILGECAIALTCRKLNVGARHGCPCRGVHHYEP